MAIQWCFINIVNGLYYHILPNNLYSMIFHLSNASIYILSDKKPVTVKPMARIHKGGLT